jgi:hypothetical protein
VSSDFQSIPKDISIVRYRAIADITTFVLIKLTEPLFFSPDFGGTELELFVESRKTIRLFKGCKPSSTTTLRTKPSRTERVCLRFPLDTVIARCSLYITFNAPL